MCRLTRLCSNAAVFLSTVGYCSLTTRCLFLIFGVADIIAEGWRGSSCGEQQRHPHSHIKPATGIRVHRCIVYTCIIIHMYMYIVFTSILISSVCILVNWPYKNQLSVYM